MSKEAVSAFLRKVANDEKLQEALTGFARQHGYDFTADELSEADLDNVAGGAEYIKFGDVEGETSSGDDGIKTLQDSEVKFSTSFDSTSGGATSDGR